MLLDGSDERKMMQSRKGKIYKWEHFSVKNLVLSAMFVSIGVILPFFTGQIQQIGNMLLPMHLPVFLCGFICGWQYGAVVGLVLPILRSVLFGMPVLYPAAIAMAVELAVYGFSVGFLYGLRKKQTIWSVYFAMFPAMLLGRIAWGVAQIVLIGLGNQKFTWQIFLAGAFLNAIPGIILQLVLIPTIMSALHLTTRRDILKKQK